MMCNEACQEAEPRSSSAVRHVRRGSRSTAVGLTGLMRGQDLQCQAVHQGTRPDTPSIARSTASDDLLGTIQETLNSLDGRKFWLFYMLPALRIPLTFGPGHPFYWSTLQGSCCQLHDVWRIRSTHRRFPLEQPTSVAATPFQLKVKMGPRGK